MPASKKKKARGKARRAAKSRKAEEDEAVKNGIDSQMQRLQISSNKNTTIKDEGEDALLEAAINLAAAEKEELEAAAKNDEFNNSEMCDHGLVLLPPTHVCEAFIQSFTDVYGACCASYMGIIDSFEKILEATKSKYAEVWNDPDNLQWLASYFLSHGTHFILEGNYHRAGVGAMCSSFFEQWVAMKMYQSDTPTYCNWNIFEALCDWGKISELIRGDMHTLVSFFRKRIPCKCLDNKYKEVKSIAKIGNCYNPNCSLPDNKTVRSEMLYCTQCRKANYCSKECQVAHWPTHKKFCVAAASMRAAQKLRQKRSRQSRSEDSS